MYQAREQLKWCMYRKLKSNPTMNEQHFAEPYILVILRLYNTLNIFARSCRHIVMNSSNLKHMSRQIRKHIREWKQDPCTNRGLYA